MIFTYHKEAQSEQLVIEGDEYRYLIKSRRHRVGDVIDFRNLADEYIYSYEIESISRREALLKLILKELKPSAPKRFFHLGWCVIDPKSIEKTLPMLNEIGVSKISFIYCERSQKNFKIDIERLQKILIASCMQSGRSHLMHIEVLENLQAFSAQGNFAVINFSDNRYTGEGSRVLIGCEGGFSEVELAMCHDIYGLGTDFVLRSESASVAVASLNLL